MICQECGRKKGPKHPIIKFMGSRMCVPCFNAEHLTLPVFGEKCEQAHDRAQAFIEGYGQGKRREKLPWFLLGFVVALFFVQALDMIGGWLG